MTDVRGLSGENFSYELTIRRPRPDFKVTLTGNNPTINAGSGKPFTVKAERIDNFRGRSAWISTDCRRDLGDDADWSFRKGFMRRTGVD